MTTKRPLRVFLCHSSADKPAVRELYQKLRAEPWIEPWLDEEELFPGQDWETEIEKAVEASDVVLVCLSNGSINKRGYVQKELRFALDIALEIPEETIFIVPLRLEECTPPRSLRDWQYADYFDGQQERAFEKLLISLKTRTNLIDLKGKSETKEEMVHLTSGNMEGNRFVREKKVAKSNKEEQKKIDISKNASYIKKDSKPPTFEKNSSKQFVETESEAKEKHQNSAKSKEALKDQIRTTFIVNKGVFSVYTETGRLFLGCIVGLIVSIYVLFFEVKSTSFAQTLTIIALWMGWFGVIGLITYPHKFSLVLLGLGFVIVGMMSVTSGGYSSTLDALISFVYTGITLGLFTGGLISRIFYWIKILK